MNLNPFYFDISDEFMSILEFLVIVVIAFIFLKLFDSLNFRNFALLGLIISIFCYIFDAVSTIPMVVFVLIVGVMLFMNFKNRSDTNEISE